MKKTIYLNNKEISYEMEIKKVKNINLRIRRDGTIYISANNRVSQQTIESFIISKTDFILNALEKSQLRKENLKTQYFSEKEIVDIIIAICNEVYPYFREKGIAYPQIKFRKMVSCWGSCRPVKGILTFNTNLMYAPIECIRYVVIHEFTHFLQANHSKEFYKELSAVCPEWQMCRKKLKEIPCIK